MEQETENSELVEDFDTMDEDSCSIKEVEVQFPNRYIEVHVLKVTKDSVSCSGLLADNHLTHIASVLSDKSVVVVDKETFKVDSKFSAHEKEITEIRFSPLNPNIIYTSSLDGKIKLWDSRSNCLEKTIDTNTVESKKPLTSFDISPKERLVCAGTELIGEDSFLLFWDLRGDKLLGGYWDSHSDDITCIRFNPNHSETLASAGSDGLVNVFDVSQSSEEKALTYSLNAEDIVNTFCWRNESKKTNILAYTDVHSVQLWDIEKAAPSHTFSREKITKSLKRSVSYECYPIPGHDTSFNKNPIILAGSGLEHEESSCLRTLTLNERSGSLEPHGLLVCKGDKLSSVTQVASFSPDFEQLITAREDGIISLWRKKESANNEAFKMPKSKRRNKIKPY